MQGRRRKAGVLSIAVAMLGFGLLPSASGAYSRTYLNLTDLYPTGGAGSVGPANLFPSQIVVRGLKGRVTKATVTIIGYRSASPDDTDLVVAKGTGKVMLMSDACGNDPLQNDNWTFADSAPTFISKPGPCGNYLTTAFKPSNYLGNLPEPDDLSLAGGPPPPYRNALSTFNNRSPNGTWRLFALDDDDTSGVGFDIAAWALTLKVRPPRHR
jgi:hypothetical protein